MAQPVSTPPANSPASVSARPQKLRKVAYIGAGAIVIVFVVIAALLTGKTDSGKSLFRPEDQVAMVLLGLIVAGGVLLFTRPLVIADASGIRVRNLGGWRQPLSWDDVAAVRFDRGSPWVTLDLPNDDVINVMAVQANDKEYAVQAVRSLRALLAASRVPQPDQAA